jgi:outer membrane protein assembly factor BamB
LGACPHDAVAQVSTTPATGRSSKKHIEPPLAAVLPAEQAWVSTLPSAPSASAVMDEARVYIPLQGEHLIAIDRRTGDKIWMVDIESNWPPLVSNGIVYVAASDELHAIDAATGGRKWRVPLGRGPMSALEATKDTIVALVSPDEVWALRSSDGERIWQKSLGGQAAPASMSIDAGRVFVAIGDRLVRLELSDGTVRWERTLPGMLRSPVAANRRVFVGSTANAIYGIDQDKGSVAWRFRVGADVIGAAVDRDLVYVASLDNVLRALEQGNGNLKWKKPLPTRPVAPPEAVGGIVAVSGLSYPLSTFNAKTGAPLANYDASLDLGRAKYLPPTLLTPELRPFSVALVVISSDGRATGQRPIAMMFRDPPLEPLVALPGKPLARERALP